MRREQITRIAVCSALILFACSTSLYSTVVLPKTLDRTEDPVIIEGKDFPERILGLPIENYGLFAYLDGKFSPIPFQIDERKNGDYVFPLGPKADEDIDDGKFDADDELVFMVKDSGGYAPQPFWPKGVKLCAPIEITDPLNDKKAWAFLFLFDKRAPRSKTDYVRYEHKTETIYAQRYVMSFHPKAKLGFGYLAITKEGNGPGGDVNSADRLKIRFEATTILGIKIQRHEEDFTSKTIAWIDGPVRIIRRVKARIILFLKIPSPAAKLDNIYYFNSFEFPVLVDLPFDPSKFFKSSTFRVSSDGLCKNLGKRFYNSRNKEGVIIDGRMSEDEKNLDLGTYTWMLATGPKEHPGGWFSRLFYDKNSPTHPKLYYVDDRTRSDPPEDSLGQCAEIGYYIENLQLLKNGTFELISVMHQIPHYEPGDEVEYLNIVDHPLQVKCSLAEPMKAPPERVIP